MAITDLTGTRRLLPWLVLLLVAGPAAEGAAPSFELQEHLNVPWHAELVHFDVELGEGEFADGPVVVEGAGQTLPAQLYDVSHWPDGSVRNARVAFIVDLGPRESHTYRLRPASEAETTPERGDLTTHHPDEQPYVELSTPHVGWRLLSERSEPGSPMPPDDVPGPIAAMRVDGDAWIGASAMYGNEPIVSYEGELVDDGPVFARWRGRYEYENGTVLELEMSLAAGDAQARWQMHSQRPDEPVLTPEIDADGSGRVTLPEVPIHGGWRLNVTRGLDELHMPIEPEHGENRWGERGDGEVLVNLHEEPASRVVSLVPWRNWWDQQTKVELRFTDADGGTLWQLASRRPEAWIEPVPQGQWVSHANPRMRQQWVPLHKREEGGLYFEFNDAPGWRKWTIGQSAGESLRMPKIKRDHDTPGDDPTLGHHLDTVKDYVLDWEGDKDTHPRLYVTRDQLEAFRAERDVDSALIEELKERAHERIDEPSWRDRNPFALYLLTGSKEVAEEYEVAERLKTHLGLLGQFDVMRGAAAVACEYDAIIDSEIITSEQRPVLQSQLAYLGYAIASAENWSRERGYASGNLNMTVAHVLNLGVIAATIPEHPEAEAWAASALAMMDQWLEENVGPAGEFLGAGESVANYTPVSLAKMVTFGIAATNAGFAEYVNDDRLKRAMDFLARQITPPHPGLEGVAGTPPSGRGPAQQRPGIFGLMARAAAKDDPTFANAQQWTWQRLGYSHDFVSDRLAGLNHVYMDRDRPAEPPHWDAMDVFPKRGTIMRQHVGTPQEYYVNFLVDPRAQTVFHSENGAFPAIWAHGAPIASRFRGRGYAEREAMLIGRVIPAWNVNAADEPTRRERFNFEGEAELHEAAPMPRQDYARGRFVMSAYRSRHDEPIALPRWPGMEADAEATLPMTWDRQVLFVKGDERASYLVLRDTVAGGASRWQMWTKSHAIAPPADVEEREAFVTEAPGNEATDAREIFGNRFTAVGQFDVDVDYFIAAPAATPRHTLRMGVSYHIPTRHEQYQDLLHLQREDDGHYYVVMFPREASEPAPTFRTLDQDRIIEISGAFGTDYVFLADEPTSATAEAVEFEGTAASAQARDGEHVLSLGSEGTVQYDDLGLSGQRAAALHVADDGATLTVAEADEAWTLELELEGQWRLAAAATDRATLQRRDGRWVVEAEADTRTIALVRE